MIQYDGKEGEKKGELQKIAIFSLFAVQLLQTMTAVLR